MSTDVFDVVVLGAGPGGYAGAFRAADLGLKVALVDPEANPGGVCLYRGCIPSKALLHVAAVIEESKSISHAGLEFAPPKINLDKLRDFKNEVVGKMTQGLGKLTKARNISYFQGLGTFKSKTEIEVALNDGSRESIQFKNCIIATGSRPTVIPGLAPDSDRIMDSTGALDLPDIPESLLCVGGGIIGMEIATVYAALGTKVSVVEMLPQLLTGADPDLTRILMRSMKSRLSDVMLETKVTSMKEVEGGIECHFEGAKVKEPVQTFSRVLMCIGRRPNSENIGLENAGLSADERGFIKVDHQMRTAVPNIFAIGDIVGNPMLAHKATHEAHTAAEVIGGHKVQFAPASIPSVVYTDPEIAWCGLTEEQAKADGTSYKVGKFPWGASGRATSMSRTDGLTKILFDPETEQMLGMGIAGVGAGELIGEGILALEMGANVKDIAHTIHPHPTMTETVMESAEVFMGLSDHYYAPKRK